MHRFLFSFMNRLPLRWKMVMVVLPLVIIPIILVGGIVGSIATSQAYLGITQTSKDDLDHLAAFTLDLLNSHHQQFTVYQEDKKEIFNRDLATLTNISYNLVETENWQHQSGRIDLEMAKAEARRALKRVNVGETGYIFAMTGNGVLTVHVAREGENISAERDENGRYFIREMIRKAKNSRPGEVLFITYPWRNAVLGDRLPRKKVAAYRYFKEWDWIIAVSGYLEETYEDVAFERRSFEELKEKIRSKQVGKTGYIFCMDSHGTFMVHPDAEGKNFFNIRDDEGHPFIQEMCEKKEGWIRYPWRNQGEKEARMKIVRYVYFPPWDWIVAVGSYEDEFYHEANEIRSQIFGSMLFLIVVIGMMAMAFVFIASQVLTDPINHMISVIRRVKQGRLDERMEVESSDELGELAGAFNRMTAIIKRNKEMEATLAQQGKMASLGVLSSGVAHEINNPLGVILGYAGYVEGKLTPDDPNYKYIHEIKRESKRCKKIVQDLLSYARTPRPVLEPTDLNDLLEQIIDFAANHTDLHNVRIQRSFEPDLPLVQVDGDQMRQVAINLILNAGSAMADGGVLTIATARHGETGVAITFSDTGSGIPAENLEMIFEPFFTTKARGTGLGLAITRQIVELHQGKIEIDSEMGKGTTVRVILPLERYEL
ncbi:MAG TPA: cache domain-containing protein [Geobacterales bacterium]|nr:cache domain-containing protein [Geobacterales bacterium]